MTQAIEYIGEVSHGPRVGEESTVYASIADGPCIYYISRNTSAFGHLFSSALARAHPYFAS